MLCTYLSPRDTCVTFRLEALRPEAPFGRFSPTARRIHSRAHYLSACNSSFCSVFQQYECSFAASSCSAQAGVSVCITSDLHVLLLCQRIRPGGFTRSKRLVEVGNDIINMFSPNRYSDKILRDSAIFLFLVAQLFMCGRPRVNCQRLRVANTNIFVSVESRTKPDIGQRTSPDLK